VVADLLESGAGTPVIERQYPLRQVSDAICDFEDGRATRTVVSTVE
jgi:hypothetical protein